MWGVSGCSDRSCFPPLLTTTTFKSVAALFQERELAALADEKGRQLADEKGRQESELRQRRLRRRTSSPSNDFDVDSSNDGVWRSLTKEEAVAHDYRRSTSMEKKADGYYGHAQGASPKAGASGSSEASSREMLEAAARASLRTKFDHVGIDPHSSSDRDVRHIAENRGMTNSPPPPSLAMSAAPSNIAHAGVAGFVRQHLPESDHHTIARVPSPILFSPGNESPMHATHTNMNLLQLHHTIALAGALSRPPPLDLMGNLLGTSDNADLEVSETTMMKKKKIVLFLTAGLTFSLG